MSAETCPVVRIADPKAPGGFVEINETDYDSKRHTIYDENPPKKEAVKPAVKTAPTK